MFTIDTVQLDSIDMVNPFAITDVEVAEAALNASRYIRAVLSGEVIPQEERVRVATGIIDAYLRARNPK